MSEELVMPQEYADPTGWTAETIWPVMDRPYHMGCCDCGLVHDIAFGVIKKARGRDFGGYRPNRVGRRAEGPTIYAKRDKGAFSPRAVQITMSVRRNVSLTAALRARDANR